MTGGPENQVREILVAALGHNGTRPLLMLRVDDQVLLYQAYRYPRGSLKMRFRKVTQTILMKEKKSR